MREIKMREAFDYYFKVHILHKKSYASFKSMAKHLIAFFGEKSVHNVTEYDVMNYRLWRERVAKASTVNREQTILTHLFHLLSKQKSLGMIDWEIPVNNPCSLVKKADERQFVRKIVLKDEQFWKFLSYLKRTESSDICLMAVLTMLRRKDLMNLCRDNINEGNGMLEGIQCKTGKPYQIPITPPILQIISKTKAFRLLNFKNFRRDFEQARRMSDVNFRFSDLRRTGARTLLSCGNDLDVVRKLLGHSDLRTTQFYVGSSSEEVSRASNMLANHFSRVAA